MQHQLLTPLRVKEDLRETIYNVVALASPMPEVCPLINLSTIHHFTTPQKFLARLPPESLSRLIHHCAGVTLSPDADVSLIALMQ